MGKETGEKTDWMIKTYDNDAAAELQGASYMGCRANNGAGSSDCADYCEANGSEMKGCMKGDGMEEWRNIEHWAAKTTGGESSWTCASDSTTDSCGCGVNSLLEVAEDVVLDSHFQEEDSSEEETQFCSPYCVSKPKGKKAANMKKLIIWKDAGVYVRLASMFSR